jgi:hypothetical protein
MKTALKVIKNLVKKYPNDMELGFHVRHFIRQLEEARGENKS